MRVWPTKKDHPDTRRKHRDIVNLVRHRYDLLSGEDKALIQMVFENGSSFVEIAKLTGQNPSSIARRFRALLHKLLTNEMPSLRRYRELFDAMDICVCRLYFLQGLPKMTIARKMHVSLYRVRKAITKIQSCFSDETRPRRNRIPKSTSKLKGATDAHV